MHSPSPSTKSIATDFKRVITSHLPADAKVLATVNAKVYHAPFGGGGDSWTYSGLRGTLVFGRDRITVHADKKLGTSLEQRYWFRLLDLDGGKGLVWMHQIPEKFSYRLDKPFFHVFDGKTRMFGFRFEEDEDASKFFKKVMSHLPANDSASTQKLPDVSPTPPKRRISRSMISAPSPGTFKHVGHVGFDRDGRIEVSDDIEPGWTMMLGELKGYGVSETVVNKDRDFVDGFLAGFKARVPKPTKVNLGVNFASERSSKTIRRKPVVNFG